MTARSKRLWRFRTKWPYKWTRHVKRHRCTRQSGVTAWAVALHRFTRQQRRRSRPLQRASSGAVRADRATEANRSTPARCVHAQARSSHVQSVGLSQRLRDLPDLWHQLAPMSVGRGKASRHFRWANAGASLPLGEQREDPVFDGCIRRSIGISERHGGCSCTGSRMPGSGGRSGLWFSGAARQAQGEHRACLEGRLGACAPGAVAGGPARPCGRLAGRSVSRWHAHWCTRRACCCSTNRGARSTRSRASRFTG